MSAKIRNLRMTKRFGVVYIISPHALMDLNIVKVGFASSKSRFRSYNSICEKIVTHRTYPATSDIEINILRFCRSKDFSYQIEGCRELFRVRNLRGFLISLDSFYWDEILPNNRDALSKESIEVIEKNTGFLLEQYKNLGTKELRKKWRDTRGVSAYSLRYFERLKNAVPAKREKVCTNGIE